MSDSQSSETTHLLQAWAKGDNAALAQLTPRVYRELRRLAGFQMQNERPGVSIQPTELVHEAYFRLVDVKNVDWQHRAHFFAVAATIMRHILLDRARKRMAAKRGGGAPTLDLDRIPEAARGPDRELIALDHALVELAAADPRQARVVELRFFGGLNMEESATVLGVSTATIQRDWNAARAWLLAQIGR